MGKSSATTTLESPDRSGEQEEEEQEVEVAGGREGRGTAALRPSSTRHLLQKQVAGVQGN